MQAAVKRFYKTYNILKMETAQLGAATITDFEYQAADKAQDSDATFPVRSGLLGARGAARHRVAQLEAAEAARALPRHRRPDQLVCS